MNKLLEYLRLICFVGGVLVGVQLPSLVDQYGKSLQAHYLESQLSVAEFQDDADKFFAGSIEKLIEYYRKNPDPVVNEGGLSIDALFQRHEQLRQAYQMFNANIYSPYVQTLFNPIVDIKQEVLASYTYAVILNHSAIMVGLLVGVISALLLELVTSIVSLLIGGLYRKLSPPSPKLR
ncbi:MAG: DUF2937 family protein [Steroidobacteraceae bacterium]